ncbi:MAG TPA: DUF4870 domain-containing protein [Thermoanaerobaculia bacterium]|nr:DUF4870 domain-containing protein [Thermoanaerobaculia bacterium]
MSELPPPSAPPPPAPPASGSSDRNVMLFLAYFGIFALIPLLTKKDDADLQWHSKNGLGYAVGTIMLWVVLFFVGLFLPGPLKLIWFPFTCLVWLAVLVGWILALVKAFKGERMIFPVITDIATKINI